MAREEQQPMSAARIEAIERHIARWLTPDVSALDLRNDLIEAMVENERLRAREAALLEVVRAVAGCDPVHEDGNGWPTCTFCSFEGEQHQPSCAWLQARSLVPSSASPAASNPPHIVSVDDLASMDLRHCEVEAACACGNPVAGMFIQDTYDREEVREFFASACRVHQSWCPSSHTLSLKVRELPERSAKLASDSADEAK